MKIVKKLNQLTVGKIRYWYFEPITVIVNSSWSLYKLCDNCIYPDKPDLDMSAYKGYYCEYCHHVKRIYKNRAMMKWWNNIENQNSKKTK